ncbi:MAG: hypothetical protein U0M13_13675 [Desulfovibrio fairfieldensis]|nr:hypothetical protein [Desulfovibrio fairfieldensis]
MPKINYGINEETMLSGLPNAKTKKLREINEKCDAMLKALTATYPDVELLTFDQQKEEAKIHQVDPTADCPLLAPLAVARGISLDDLCNRVLLKAAAFSAASGAIIGQRQAMEDYLDACTTVAEVQEIEVSYALPGASE